MNRLRNWLRGLFGRRHRTTAEIVGADITTRQAARYRNWTIFAANGNRLTAANLSHAAT